MSCAERKVWSHVQGQEPSVKIGEVARVAGVSIDTVRFYEQRGVLPPAPRRPSGYREYSTATVGRIQLARRMQSVGLSLDEIIDALSAHDTRRATCESEGWRLDAALARVDTRIAELKALRRQIISTKAACAKGQCTLTTDAT